MDRQIIQLPPRPPGDPDENPKQRDCPNYAALLTRIEKIEADRKRAERGRRGPAHGRIRPVLAYGRVRGA